MEDYPFVIMTVVIVDRKKTQAEGLHSWNVMTHDGRDITVFSSRHHELDDMALMFRTGGTFQIAPFENFYQFVKGYNGPNIGWLYNNPDEQSEFEVVQPGAFYKGIMK